MPPFVMQVGGQDGYVLNQLFRFAYYFCWKWFVGLTLFQLRALLHGPEAYARFSARLQSPVMIAFNLIAFCFVMFHAITWFNLAPRAMAVRIGGKRVPEFLVAAPNYALWIIVSAFVGWLLLRTP